MGKAGRDWRNRCLPAEGGFCFPVAWWCSRRSRAAPGCYQAEQATGCAAWLLPCGPGASRVSRGPVMGQTGALLGLAPPLPGRELAPRGRPAESSMACCAQGLPGALEDLGMCWRSACLRSGHRGPTPLSGWECEGGRRNRNCTLELGPSLRACPGCSSG